jgi:lysozyme
MLLGEAGLALIKRFEQCRLSAYFDTNRVPTIGWGHTKGVKMGDTCTQEQADAWLLEDASDAIRAVNHLIDVALTQNQFDALVCFTFNVGSSALCVSTLRRLLNQGRTAAAATQFARWNHDNGVVIDGLTKRRAAERALFETNA